MRGPSHQGLHSCPCTLKTLLALLSLNGFSPPDDMNRDCGKHVHRLAASQAFQAQGLSLGHLVLPGDPFTYVIGPRCCRVSLGSKPLSCHSSTAQLCFPPTLGTAGFALLVGTSFHHYIATCHLCQHVSALNQSFCMQQVLGNRFASGKSPVGATAEVLKSKYMQTNTGTGKWRCTSRHRTATAEMWWDHSHDLSAVMVGTNPSGETEREEEEGGCPLCESDAQMHGALPWDGQREAALEGRRAQESWQIIKDSTHKAPPMLHTDRL